MTAGPSLQGAARGLTVSHRRTAAHYREEDPGAQAADLYFEVVRTILDHLSLVSTTFAARLRPFAA
eukprot:3317278-Rhodomonas_salina.1